jgi:hypothetical protein
LEDAVSNFTSFIAAAALSMALAAPALAREGHHEGHGDFHHHGFFRGGVFVYDPFYGYPGYPSYPGYAQGGYWYFCPAANAYYPNVPSCPTPWQLVPVQ